MTLKHLSLCAAALLALAPLVATAQQTGDVSAYKEAEDDDLIVQPLNLTVDQVEDMDVKGTDGKEIGEVEKVLLDSSGQPAAVTVEVGGFLGIGEHEVVLGLDQLKQVDDDFVVEATEDSLKTLPEWKD